MNELESKRAEIQAALLAIEAEIHAAVSAARAGNIADVLELMTTHGLTVSDLGPAVARAHKVAKTAKTAAVAMYRNETGQTYGGRGNHPNWLRDALAAGRDLASFRIGA